MKGYYRVSNALAILVLSVTSAQADGTHDHHFLFGSPGKESEVTKTIKVEANDEMRFVHEKFEIRLGDTLKFIVTNTGQLRHEAAIEDKVSQIAHAKMMKEMPDMVHNDPNVVTLEPGETKTLIWKFDKPVKGNIEFACHQPGHYEAGMVSSTAIRGLDAAQYAQYEAEVLAMGEQGGHSHGGHHSHRGMFGPYLATREASGTSWQPESTPHE